MHGTMERDGSEWKLLGERGRIGGGFREYMGENV